jgi:predicted AlkP superfamily pyrophosphatase or phosphodiesterase
LYSLTLDQKPRLIVISYDGFSANYLKKYADASDYFLKFGQVSGTMIPSFPSMTFVNHNSIMTGKYPQDHGIISNNMWDPTFNASFNTAGQDNFNPRWWLADTFWVTTEKQNIKTGVVMWPGSEVKIGGFLPSFHTKYSSRAGNVDRVRMILDMIDDSSKNPSFIAAYFQRLDDLGHELGPNDPEIPKEIRNSSSSLQYLMEQLGVRNLLNHTDVIVVSDHGMAQVNNYVLLDDVVPNFMDRVFVYEWQASKTPICVICNLEVRNPSEIDSIMMLLNADSGITCYLKNDIPDGWNVKTSQRVGQIMCVSKNGIVMTLKSQTSWRPLGEHGYDNASENMKAIFLAQGPSFQKKVVLDEFQNVELLNVFGKILGVEVGSNNGTLDFYKRILVV